MLGRLNSRTVTQFRLLIVLGAVVGMPILALPSVSRFVDRILYAPADCVTAADASVGDCR
jgi:hypothetical protein